VPASRRVAKTQADPSALLSDLRSLVQSARQRLATAANATYTLLCWQIGRRLLRDNLQARRAAYGKQILATLSQTLSWSHFVELLPIEDPLARDFYAEKCRIERWDVRTLRQKIGGMRYQRTALSKRPKAVISAEIRNLRDGQTSPDTVRGGRRRAGGTAAAGREVDPCQRVPHGLAAAARAARTAAPGVGACAGAGGAAPVGSGGADLIGDLKPYADYKDSELPWLGQVPTHWRVVRNGSLFGQRSQTGIPNCPSWRSRSRQACIRRPARRSARRCSRVTTS